MMKRGLGLLLALVMMMILPMGSWAEDSTSAAATAVEAEDLSGALSEIELNKTAVMKDFMEDATTAYGLGEYVGDKIYIALTRDGGTFDPFGGWMWGDASFVFYQHLADSDSAGNMRLTLLKSVEEVDELTYKCTLWDFIYDSDGNQLTASDVKWCFDKFVASGNAGSVTKLDSIEVVDDYTFLWHNKTAFKPGEIIKHFSSCYMVTQASYEAHGDMVSVPVGTGPYVLEEYVEGSSLKVNASEDFWMRKIDDADWIKANNICSNFQNYKAIEFDVIGDDGSRAIALEQGAVSAVDNLADADINYFRENPDLGVSVVALPEIAPIAYYYNCNAESVCSDVNLRKAIAYAIDSASIVAGLDSPSYVVHGIAPGMYDAPASWLSGEGVDYYEYNMDKAVELLGQSNYQGEPVTVMYLSSNIMDAVAIMMQDQLDKVGIKVELYPVERSVLSESQYNWSKWDICFDSMDSGTYVASVAMRFTHDEKANMLDGELNMLGIEDATLEELALKLADDYLEESITAWDQYFTYDQCYAYAICGKFKQSGARSDVNASMMTIESHAAMCPGGFTLK